MFFKVFCLDDRIFNRVISDISVVLRETTLTTIPEFDWRARLKTKLISGQLYL